MKNLNCVRGPNQLYLKIGLLFVGSNRPPLGEILQETNYKADIVNSLNFFRTGAACGPYVAHGLHFAQVWLRCCVSSGIGAHVPHDRIKLNKREKCRFLKNCLKNRELFRVRK